MLEKPAALSEELLRANLQVAYGITATDLQFLPLGNDATAWAYRVLITDGRVYFLKVKRGPLDVVGWLIPRYLADQGLAQVVAPLPTLTQTLWHPLGDFALGLYPFIAGQNGMAVGLTDAQWIAHGAFLRALHSVELPADLAQQLPRETFVPKWAGVVRDLQARVLVNEHVDQHEQELATFWRKKQTEIAALVARAEALGRSLSRSKATALDFVLCHTDIHLANVLLTAEGQLRVVDWDSPLLALKERDLMFVVGATSTKPVEVDVAPLFFQGYGPTPLNWTALAYYRYEWVVQELGDFGARVFGPEEGGAATKAAAVEGFKALFEPGDVVEVAWQVERLAGIYGEELA